MQMVAADIEEERNFDPSAESGRYLVEHEGGVHCRLCDKKADESHLSSLGHLERMEEVAIASLMAGRTNSARKLVNGKLGRGCREMLTKKRFMDYWGDALPCLPMEAETRHQEKGIIYIDNKDKKPLQRKDVRGYRLGLVSYKGPGKYAQRSFHWYDDIPDCGEVMPEQWEQKTALPENQGWWPVAAMELSPQANERVGGPSPEAGKKKILIICFYQLMGNRFVAWWITINFDEGAM